MKKCNYCGAMVDDLSNFCNNCGNVINLTPPQPDAYYQTQYSTVYNNIYPPIKPSGGSKAMGIIGMILGISGFLQTLYVGIYSLIILFAGVSVSINYSGSRADEDNIFAVVFFSVIMIIAAVLSSIPGIIGFILGKKSRNNGNYGMIPGFAQGFSLANIILCGITIAVLLASIAMVSDMPISYY